MPLLRSLFRWLCRCAPAALLLSAAASAQQATYEFDPAFNGNFFIDAFTTGENTGAMREGSRIARLPNGDVVTAGLVRLDNDPVAPNWNVGLVRMSPTGVRQVWSGSGPYFHAGGQYVVYPNIAGGASGFSTINKLAGFAYADGRFYVLVRTRPAPGDDDVQLLVFREDGSYLNAINVLTSFETENAIALDVRATGLVANPVAIAVLGAVSGVRGSIAKFLVNSSGAIQFDASFGGGDGRIEFVLPLDECSYTGCEFGFSDIAFPEGGTGSAVPLYVAGSVRRNSPSSTDFDLVVYKFAENGQLDTNFDTNGVRQYAFDLPDSSNADFARALHVRRGVIGSFDTVWLLASVAGRCNRLGGIVRLDGSSGVPTSTFGPGGRIAFGAPQPPPGEACEGGDLDPYSLVSQDGELFVAATASLPPLMTAGTLVRAAADSGALRGLDTFMLPGGPANSSCRITDIALGEGGGRVYVAGSGSGEGYNSLYLTARLKPVDETIFTDGFE